MAHVEDGNHPITVVYLVDHPVIADPDAPPITARQLEATGRPGVFGQGDNRIADLGTARN